ncbi:ion transport integral membrane protein [Pseudomonas phage ventosus]|uniref:Ion transport integral membrane protein n=1 Tax=Pseudomonas phage ventosus TaxID=2048980 RepID=A0A2H4P836_9CAUD|nr:ion transport integral membrane protein [Pseudomonas phage ventosus]
MKRSILWLSNSIWRVFGLYLISVVLCALLFAWIESKSVLDSIWWACVTSLTIGYGDIAPVTTAGRALAVVFSHFWIFGVAPLVISNMLNITLEDRNLFTHEEQEEMKTLLRKLAEKA